MLQLKKHNIKIIFFAITFVLSNLYALQLGDGTTNSTMHFIKVAENVRDVYIGLYATYIVKNDNSLWGTGYNIYKKFGLNGPSEEHSFIKLMDNVKEFRGSYLIKTDNSLWEIDSGLKEIKNVKKISAGLYLFTDGKLFAIGEDTHGAFGNGRKNTYYPTLQLVRKNIVDFYSNGYYSQIITSENELLISGEHYLPDPYKISNTFFKLAEQVRYTSDGFYITNNDELYAFGYCAQGALGIGEIGNKWKTLPIKIMEQVNTVASKQQVSLILKKDGTLYGCGGKTPNYYGELGFGDKVAVLTPKFIASDVARISVGDCHTAFVKTDGTLWVCGANYFPGGM